REEEALRQAERVDQDRRDGRRPGPLAGVPLAVKDVLCTRGVPTTCGSRILKGFVPAYDATCVARLRDAGAVILGKTNMDEFAMGSSTENSAYEKTCNPWALDRVPGGSTRRRRRCPFPTTWPACGAARGACVSACRRNIFEAAWTPKSTPL